MQDGGVTLDPKVAFVETPYFRDLTARALIYLKAGIPVHLQGPPGTGKTTCALYLAQQLGRPTVLIFGNDQFTPADLVGRHFGLRRRLLVDQYVHSVEKREEKISADWVDGRLLTACKEGHTLVYDEFSRSRPEANNALLSALQEGVLELPPTYRGGHYLKVHPEFRAILTSNPTEFAGVHNRADALLDRMITIDLSHLDEESEVAITIARTGIAKADAATVVSTVRRARRKSKSRLGQSVRASIMIAQILKASGARAKPGDELFARLCADVLGPEAAGEHHPREEQK